MLVQDKLTKYEEQGGGYCPYCDDNTFVTCSSIKIEGKILQRYMLCRCCRQVWVDQYVFQMIGLPGRVPPTVIDKELPQTPTGFSP